MHSVVVAIFPGVQALDVSGPLDVFSEANAFVRRGHGSTLPASRARTAAPVRASNGMRLAPTLAFAQARRPFDVALVAGGPALPEAVVDPALADWLREVAARSPRFGSICTGAFALGAAGLLDGRTRDHALAVGGAAGAAVSVAPASSPTASSAATAR